MKLGRSAHRLCFKAPGNETFSWLGDDIDDLSVAMNGSFETKKNIKEQTSTTDNGYTPSIEVTPYYANPDDPFYEFIKNLAMKRLSGDECKAEYMEVIVEDTEAATHEAYREDCKIEIGDYGGGTDGFMIPFTIHPAGNREEGTATFGAGGITFAKGGRL